jgi:tRNA(Ile)-lysidine synthetase-like protein
LALELATQRGVMRQALALLEAELSGINFAQVESLLDHLRHQPQASGPHPLGGAIAWTVIGASGETPAALSLHRLEVLPLQPEHPYLDIAWQQEVKLMRLPQTGRIFVSGGWSLRAEIIAHDRLPTDWQQRGQFWRAFLDADQVGVPILTTPCPGLRFAPLGLQGQQKSLGDLFTDRKVPAALRSGWPVILDQTNDTVLWVCGQALGHQGRITEQTTRVLHLQWLKEANDHAR